MGASETLRVTGLLGLVAVSLVIGPGLVDAGHGSQANYTVQPATAADRHPGIEDASYKSWTAAKPSTESRESFEYLDYSVLEWEAGTLGNCGPADTEVAGIDRGNDDPGTEIDDDIRDNIEGQPVSNEDRIVVDFIDPEDPVGEPVNLNVTDEFVSHVRDCRGNPDEAGWYQLSGTINGSTYDGGYEEYNTTSHYFYVCTCASYDEATERLGPPPSQAGEDTPTATATPTADPTPTPAPEETSATPETETSTGSSTPTATDGGTATATTTDTATPTPADEPQTPTPTATPAAWAANTPSQPGFGPLVAVVSVLLVVPLRHRFGR